MYSETDDAHLLCLDARSGSLLWDVQYADKAKHYGATSAPLVVKDEIIVGTSGGDSGVRGFVAAYDARNGKMKWRLWTIPAPGEFGSSSWPGDSYLHGGGTTWMPGHVRSGTRHLVLDYQQCGARFCWRRPPGRRSLHGLRSRHRRQDRKTKMVFPVHAPRFVRLRRERDSGAGGRRRERVARRLLVQANRNGFFYVLDRTNGKFLRATPFVEKLNWAKGIDASGSVRCFQAESQLPRALTFAQESSAPPIGFRLLTIPHTGFFYVMALEGCSTYFASPGKFIKGETYYNTGTKVPPGEHFQKILLALSRGGWKARMALPAGRSRRLLGGNDDDRRWTGVSSAMTGGPWKQWKQPPAALLWHFNTGQNMHASPMSYAVDGVQYVAIAAGSDVFSFALPH